jgi:RNA polymerase sigma factor (sigma-70 family)
VSQPPFPTPEQMVTLTQVIRHVARASRLPRQDEEDFSQTVHVKLLEREYDIFRRFCGRSSLRTYLTVVVRRLLLDWRNAVQGKWRPSAAAMRLGAIAVALEQLVYRDHHQVEEAIAVLQSRGCDESAMELRALFDKLPLRHRRQTVSDDQLPDLHAAFEDPIDAAERERSERRSAALLGRLLRELPSEDRWLLRVRFCDEESLHALARKLSIEPRILYRRVDRALRRLRRSVAMMQLSDAEIH